MTMAAPLVSSVVSSAVCSGIEPVIGATLEAHDVVVALGRTRALRGVSFSVPAGWTAIVGPNGAGKSTLLNVLAGLRAPDRGRVMLNGRSLADWPPRERAAAIAWLAQQSDAGGELTVREVVQLGRLPHLGLFTAPGPADDAAVERAMADTECTPWQQRRLHELSGGERQRVLLARALAVGAGTLLFDEPTTHLDPPHQVALVRLMQRRAAAGNKVVSVLHDLSLALLADRLVVMAEGRIVAEGSPDDAAIPTAFETVFGGAVKVECIGTRWVAVPQLAA